MFYKEVARLPIRGERKNMRGNNKLKRIILDFYEDGIKYAEVLYINHEYSSASSLYSGLKRALTSLENLPIAVEYIQGGIYLRRTD